MSIFYIIIGISHFLFSECYMQIVPPIIPFKLDLVYISGFFEILFGFLLIFKRLRFIISWLIILLLIAVYPANIYLAITNGQALNISPFIAWLRLPLQFAFIFIAYWHSKD